MEAARNAVAAAGASLPDYKVPRGAAAVNGDSVLQVIAEDA
jgi:arginine decarboxylase